MKIKARIIASRPRQLNSKSGPDFSTLRPAVVAACDGHVLQVLARADKKFCGPLPVPAKHCYGTSLLMPDLEGHSGDAHRDSSTHR